MTPKLITAFEAKFVFENMWRKYHDYGKGFKKILDNRVSKVCISLLYISQLQKKILKGINMNL